MSKEDLLRKLANPKLQILYIKLGRREDEWEQDCIKNNKICIGFDLHEEEVLKALKSDNFDYLREYWENSGENRGTQTAFVNQMLRFFEDDGKNTLWVTFANERMYYCFSDGGSIDNTKRPSFRNTDVNHWMYKDINGKDLSIHSLSSALTKTRSTQTTIPDSFTTEIKEYIKRKILGLPFEHLESAKEARQDQDESKFNLKLKALIKYLHQDDFELLMEIIFSKTEWLRTSPTGGNQKTIDFAVRNFQSKDEAFVQVKTLAHQRGDKGFEDYIKRLIGSPYKKLFFIYHSGRITLDSDIEKPVKDAGKEVEVWNLDRVFTEVCKHKLHEWILWAARRC